MQNISNPISADFKTDILKMDMNKIVGFVLQSKPASIYKEYKQNQEKTIDIMMLMLIQFQDFYNCKSKMNKEQLQETAHFIVQNFRHLNYYDIGLCFKNAKLNAKVYDRIDGGMILEWLTSYDINRTGMIIQYREQEKSKQNGEWSALSERTSELTRKKWLSIEPKK
ncbi:MAG: hypothetical protein Unbinned6486contig1001_37 [Prokaryotic dsDNA virus sp.]|nr:MAG: hypothetical protein Unbinned6486contig1001_37 [Prokaryotic dsDNA virus sp.]